MAEVRQLLEELGSPSASSVTPGSSLDRDLGLGSLERVELLVRLERGLGVSLPEDGVRTAETPRDWSRIALAARGSRRDGQRWPIIQPQREAHEPPSGAETFTEVLLGQTERDPARVHCHLLDQDQGKDITQGQLQERATRVAAGLLASGLQHGETVAIMLPTGEDFFSSFLGVMLAGGIAVPVYPPMRASQIETYIERQSLILGNARVRFLVSFDQIRVVANTLEARLPRLREVVTTTELAGRGGTARLPARRPPETFFIQYTSGSTGDPKGVMLTHSNVLANIRGIGHAVEARPSDTVVSWLPLYHDMGLIGSWLFSIYHGFPITVLSPLDFLVRPERWLWALSDSRGTLCPAPNFAFELCLRKISDEMLDGVDLSPWRVAINAGEPVLASTVKRFAGRFGKWGFDARSFMPFYGLAESTVALTYPPFWRGPVIDTVDRLSFEGDGLAAPADGTETSDVLEFVGNGRPLPGHEIRVVDDHGAPAADRVRGRILFRGPSRTEGYFRNPAATEEVLDSRGWMDSGDLGYLADGELFVTGRLKDCIIVAGRNIIPQDVERAAWEVEGVRKGCVAAFGCVDPTTGTERLVILTETRVTDRARRKRLQAEVVEMVSARLGVVPDDVPLAHPGFVPKTSSGKIRRLEARRLYLRGAVRADSRAAPTWLQLGRVWVTGTCRPAVRRALAVLPAVRRSTGEVLAGSLVAAFGLAARLAPTTGAAWRVVGPGARAAIRLAGIRARSDLEGRGPAVLLANRAHRLDPLAIAAAMRSPFLFADRTGFTGLGPAQAFLLEPLLAPANGAGGRLRAPRMEATVSVVLEAGYSVVGLADNAVGESVERTRFRAEMFAAAARCGSQLVPLFLATGTAGSVSVARCQPVEPEPDRSHLAQNRRAVRDALNAVARARTP